MLGQSAQIREHRASIEAAPVQIGSDLRKGAAFDPDFPEIFSVRLVLFQGNEFAILLAIVMDRKSPGLDPQTHIAVSWQEHLRGRGGKR